MNENQITELIKSGVLLETDSNGQPTQQAKASALDALVWLASKLQEPEHAHLLLSFELWSVMSSDNPCAAIYKAACEVLGLEVDDG